MWRRFFQLAQVAFIGGVAALLPTTAHCENEPRPLFQFGAIADCQYHSSEGKRRKYNQSPDKLKACIEDFNKQELSHIVHLGDFIDRDWDSYDVVLPIAATSHVPFYHVLGNHDFSVAEEYKEKVPARLGLTERYYDFSIGKWRFLILDTNDLSLYAHPKGSDAYESSLAYFNKMPIEPKSYNGGIGPEQMGWIEQKLQQAQKHGEAVILHSHHAVYPYNNHTVWNAEEITALLEKYSCVAAYMNGHLHDGAYGFKNGIHYLTLKGMVDTEETSYSTIKVFSDRIEVHGTGRQDDYFLEILPR